MPTFVLVAPPVRSATSGGGPGTTETSAELPAYVTCLRSQHKHRTTDTNDAQPPGMHGKLMGGLTDYLLIENGVSLADNISNNNNNSWGSPTLSIIVIWVAVTVAIHLSSGVNSNPTAPGWNACCSGR